MIYLFRYSLSLIIIVLIYAKKEKHSIKQKRDISDLKDDPILTSIFKSDLQEKRSDRSISLKDEKEEGKSDNVKQQELLKNMLLSANNLYRRDTYNSPYDGGLNSSLPIPDSYFASYTNPIIGSQIPLPASAKLQSIYDQGNAENPAAVVPKLFAANYMPLENQLMSTAIPVSEANNEVTKRDSIIHPSSDVKSELVSSQSIPLQLRKYTPNKQLRGIVPHASEYGETVESVQRAQKVMDIRKSMMPGMQDAMSPAPMLLNFAPVSQSMYSQDVIKKDVIPGQLPSPAVPAVDDAPKISAPIPVDLVPKVSAPVDSAPQISAPVAVDLVPNVASPGGVEATNAEQKSTVAATQVQNLDGSYTRPIITDTNERSKVPVTDEECADQYASCVDFAKNQYCTKYYKLMEIQCRKSCGFCDPYRKIRMQEEAAFKALGDKQLDKKKEEIASPSNESSNATSQDKKLTESPKNETKGSKRSSTSKKPSDTHKKSSETSKKRTDASKKTSVSSKKSDKSKKSSDSSKKATENSKKTASKKSADTLKKHSSDTPSKSKAEAKSTTATSKKSKEEKHKEEKSKKEEKDDGDKKSKVIDSESGSTNEGDSQEDSGSGDLGSGDLGSGSGSGSGDDEPPVALEKPVEIKTKVEKEKKQEKEDKVAKKSTVSKKSKVPSPSKVAPGKITKSNLGEFTLPVAKSEVSTASLTLDEKNESDESGSGSASGDDSEVEEKVITVKKNDVGKPKSGGKATAKKSATRPKAVVVPTKKVKKNKVAIKIKKSKKPEKPSKKSKVPKPQKEKHIVTKTKKSSVPEKPKKLTSYPKIDLKLIASALAHYEEAALELAGEYPKAPSNEVARSNIPKPEPAAHVAVAATAAAAAPVATSQRSTIPHPHISESVAPPLRTYEKKELIIDPLDKYKQNLEIAKLLTDDRNGRSNIPKYLKLTKDVKKGESDEAVQSEYAADSLPSIQKRFNILGIEPTLIDYYAETGKINPFSQKHKKKDKNVKKSNILNSDPYEYLRNMPAGASMLPIDDPKARSKIPSDHSYPVFLMKVSPGERKYVDEPPMRRGEIRHLNAEGVRIDDKTEVGGLPKDILQKLKSRNAAAAAPKPNEASVKRTHQPSPSNVPAAANAAAAPVTSNPFASAGLSMYTNPFYPNAEQAMAMMSVAANLQNNLMKAQNSLPQAKTVVPKIPAAPKPQLKRPAAAKGAVPHPVPAPNGLSPATIKAMEKSAISNGFQYAQNQMKINEMNKLIARSKAQANAAARSQTMHFNAAQRQAIMAAQQRSMVKSALDIAQATSPHINPALAGETPVNDLNSLKNKMVSAFFPMKKDGVAAEGSGEVAKG